MNLIVTELPYREDSLAAFQPFLTLTSPLLLDSGHGYPDCIDVLTAEPVEQCEVGADGDELPAALAKLRSTLERYASAEPSAHPAPGWYGVWSYDLGSQTESLPLSRPHANVPRMWMGFYPALIVVDHGAKTTHLVALPGFDAQAQTLAARYRAPSRHAIEPFALTSPFSGNQPPPVYQAHFKQAQTYIHQGDCYQVNLAQRFEATYSGHPWHAYAKLRATTSAPMGGYLQGDGWSLLSLSPERFLSVDAGDVVTKPIKGTRPRGQTAEQDQRLRTELANSQKDRAENLMIVDLLRNDLGRNCQTGSIAVEALFDIESFSNVHHLVSTIRGTLKPEADALSLLEGAFPGGSITGAPKHRAMQIIDELEPHGRGFYCGSLLYLDVCGKMDSSILIRSLVAQEGTIYCWGGGGLVADSTWESEYQEILDKVGNLLNSLS